MTTEADLTAPVQALLADVRQQFSGEITLAFGDDKAGYLRHDQAQQTYHRDGSLTINVQDVTAIDYTVSHELLHLKLALEGYPKVGWQLTSGDRELDQQLVVTATDLTNSLLHVPIVKRQQALGVLTADVQKQYWQGVLNLLPAEDLKQPDPLLVFRVLTLVDALAFFQGDPTVMAKDCDQRYRNAFPAAQAFYATMTAKSLATPFHYRRALVRLYVAFDEWLAENDLPTAKQNQFTTVPAIFSERQTRLEVRQVFQILHSELVTANGKKAAYIGLGINDDQNAFVLTVPKQVPDQAAYFQKIYSMSVADFYAAQQWQLNLR